MKKMFLIAASLIALGLMMFIGVMIQYQWDFTKLNHIKNESKKVLYETNIHQISEEFHHIKMNTETADIVFVPWDNKKSKVVCYEIKDEKHAVSVQDDTLIIDIQNKNKWYGFNGMGFENPKITIYLPKDEYTSLFIKESTGDIEIPNNFIFKEMDISLSTGDVKSSASALESIKIQTSTGDIQVENTSTNRMELSASTGTITALDIDCKDDMKINVSTSVANVTNVKCKNLESKGSTGDIYLKNVIAKEKLSINRSTGEVNLDGCDANEISIDTSTGDITGSLLSEKVFMTHSDTGSVDVPKTTKGGKCEMNTTTGDININIK